MKRFYTRLALLGLLTANLSAITISCDRLSNIFANLSDAFSSDSNHGFFDDLADIFD